MVIKEVEVKTIINKTNLPGGDFCANPYIGCTHKCKYCYATYMRRNTNHFEPWGEFLDIKYWPKIKNPNKYDEKEIFISSATDPYLPEEEKYGRTRELLSQLEGTTAYISIQTKSDLVLKDLDLIKTFKHIRVGFSINTLDDEFRKKLDDSVSIERKLNAMKKLYDEGILTTCFIAPIFPGITNIKAIIKEVKDYCDFIWLENLDLQNDSRYQTMSFVKDNYPQLIPLYESIYFRRNRTHWTAVENDIHNFADKNDMKYLNHSDTWISESKPIITNFFHY